MSLNQSRIQSRRCCKSQPAAHKLLYRVPADACDRGRAIEIRDTNPTEDHFAHTHTDTAARGRKVFAFTFALHTNIKLETTSTPHVKNVWFLAYRMAFPGIGEVCSIQAAPRRSGRNSFPMLARHVWIAFAMNQEHFDLVAKMVQSVQRR